jgi:DNA (cytosine-5)-methyltransferase 1
MPEVVIIENVAGLFTSNKGRDFGVILQTLSSLGYSVAWRLLNSRYFGVPQSRTRVYLCCWKNNPLKSLNVMFDQQGAIKPKNERLDFITEESKSNEYPKVPKVAYCLAASSGRHTGTDWSRTALF